MTDFIAHHPWASMALAFLLGMLLEWLLEMFFLRRSLFDMEHELGQRERDVAALRHEQARTLTELRNKLTELDATQRSLQQAEQDGKADHRKIATQDRLIADLRQEMLQRDSRIAKLEARLAEAVVALSAPEKSAGGKGLDMGED